MRRATLFSLILICSLGFTTGCWDRQELNDLSIILGWGMDITKDGTHLATAEVAIPAKLGGKQGGGGGKGYFVETATGKNVLDAAQNMQAKVSRVWFASHRRVGLLGEELARQGVDDVLDTWSRDPIIRLRTDMLVVKGGEARDILEAPFPGENIPALGVLKEHKALGGVADTAFLEFLKAATTEGSSPTLPAIAVEKDQQGQTKGFQIVGTAIFNQDLKLVGYLDMNEGREHHWIAGRLKKQVLTVDDPRIGGMVSVDVTKMGSKIQPVIKGKQLHFNVTLTGKGSIKENDTHLDLTKTKNLELVETALDREVANDTLETITKVQKEYGTDIFGFGAAVYRKYPMRWETLKSDWDKSFREATVTVHAHLTVPRMGLTRAPLQLKDNRIRK